MLVFHGFFLYTVALIYYISNESIYIYIKNYTM